MAKSILREIAENRRRPATALAHWLAIFSPPPPGVAKMASRPTSQGTSSGAASIMAHDDVYILEPLPEMAAQEATEEIQRKR